jgi:maleylacetoacetate isomerase
MKLHGYWRSSAAYRVRIAFNIKQLRVEHLPRSLRDGEQRSPDYLALNPQGLVPALQVGEQVLTQSLAIIEYLDETHPVPKLLPVDPLARAQVRSLALAIACDIHPLNNLRVLQYLKRELAQEQLAIDRWYRHWIAQGFAALEQQAGRFNGDGRHLYGSSVTLADVCLVPQMYNARRLECDLSGYPRLVAISAALEALPAFAAAAPQLQADAER